MTKKLLIPALIILPIILAVLIFRPVPIVAEKDAISLAGKVTEVSEGGTKDLVLKLEGRKEIFYVNRGLERGLDLNDMKAQLTGQEVLLKYPEHWSLLNPRGALIHISKIQLSGKTIFTELKY